VVVVDVEQRKERGGAGARDELKEAVRKKVRSKRNVSLFALSFLFLPLIFLFFSQQKKNSIGPAQASAQACWNMT
jgi:hypothetical protein